MSLSCSWKYALLMSWCFNFNDFTLFEKLTDILIEPSTLLVESTNWSCARRLCNSSVCRIGTISQAPSGCAPSIPSIFFSYTQPFSFQLHRSPLVSSSAWGLVTPRAFARVRARSHHQIFRQISIVDLPRILLILSGLFPSQVRFLVPSLRSPQLFSSDHHL